MFDFEYIIIISLYIMRIHNTFSLMNCLSVSRDLTI